MRILSCVLALLPVACAAGRLRSLYPEAVTQLAAGDPNTPKYAKVVFNNNVTGTLLISQANAAAPVVFTWNITGLAKEKLPSPFHVHKYPAMDGCGLSITAGHFNTSNFPFQRRCKGGCETGDLSSKVGPLNATSAYSTFNDTELTLFGFNSFVGRSMILHATDGARVSCGTIKLVDTPMVAAKAVFEVGVKGSVMMVQPEKNPHADTIVWINLKLDDAAIASAPQRATSLQTNATTTVGNVTYMIHERGAKDGSCNGVGAFYNPRRKAACTAKDVIPGACQLGDLVGRHGKISLPAFGNQSVIFTDFLPLSGKYSVIGRAFAVHVGGAMYCATLKKVDSAAPFQ